MSKRRAVGILNGNWKSQWRDQQQGAGEQYWLDQEKDWMGMCAEVEGPSAFQAWYEDDKNIPAFGKAGERVKLLVAHYETLRTTHAETFYWLGVEKQEAARCIEIEGRESFRDWWNSDAIPATATPKDRVEMIRARITAFLENDGTTQVQARVRVLRGALSQKKGKNRKEIILELAGLVNHIQKVGALPDSGG